jgi:PleD family two-component response regulator
MFYLGRPVLICATTSWLERSRSLLPSPPRRESIALDGWVGGTERAFEDRKNPKGEMVFPEPPSIVLVVEDDHQLRELYRMALRAAGYAVVAVEDGLDALEFAAQQYLPQSCSISTSPAWAGSTCTRNSRHTPRQSRCR